MSYLNTNELKNALTPILQSYELNDIVINQLLSDEFINGAFELTQNEPENDDFMSFARSFSEEQNLYSIIEAQDKIRTELCQEGYFTSIFQYVIDAWRNIDFSNSTIMQISSIEDWQQGNDYPYETMKTALTITAGIIIGGWCGSLLLPAIGAGVVGSLIDNYWDDIRNQFDDLLDIKSSINASFTTAHEQASPLALDLDGDGVETTTVESGVYFDHDDNGFAEKSGWVGKDDGLLVRDINDNGLIDDGTELFGNNSVLSSGEKAA